MPSVKKKEEKKKTRLNAFTRLCLSLVRRGKVALVGTHIVLLPVGRNLQWSCIWKIYKDCSINSAFCVIKLNTHSLQC